MFERRVLLKHWLVTMMSSVMVLLLLLRTGRISYLLVQGLFLLFIQACGLYPLDELKPVITSTFTPE